MDMHCIEVLFMTSNIVTCHMMSDIFYAFNFVVVVPFGMLPQSSLLVDNMFCYFAFYVSVS